MPRTDLVELGGGLGPNAVLTAGSGRPVVFLHGPFGQEWTGYLDDLAGSHRVLAPASPGADEPEDLRHLEHLWDLVLYYDELFGQLGLEEIDLIGHSFGGMVAAEFAAAFPTRVRRLVLVAAMGLWRDEEPVNEFVLVSPEKLDRCLWHDPTSPAVTAHLTGAGDGLDANTRMLRRFGAIASTAHFSFPLPERGLNRRLRRVGADTLLVWGEGDGLVPVGYAADFARLLPRATSEIIAEAGHYPHVEQRQHAAAATLDFLAGDSDDLR